MTHVVGILSDCAVHNTYNTVNFVDVADPYAATLAKSTYMSHESICRNGVTQFGVIWPGSSGHGCSRWPVARPQRVFVAVAE